MINEKISLSSFQQRHTDFNETLDPSFYYLLVSMTVRFIKHYGVYNVSCNGLLPLTLPLTPSSSHSCSDAHQLLHLPMSTMLHTLLQTETASVDADIQKEFGRQKEHLERSVASLRKKLEKDSEIHKADNVRIMQASAYAF